MAVQNVGGTNQVQAPVNQPESRPRPEQARNETPVDNDQVTLSQEARELNAQENRPQRAEAAPSEQEATESAPPEGELPPPPQQPRGGTVDLMT